MQNTLKTIKDYFFIIGPLTTFLCYMGWLLVKDTDIYQDVKQTIEFGYEARTVIIPKSDSLNKWQTERINELTQLVGKLSPQERTQFAVGLMYDTQSNKLFFRDITKELRPVLYEEETGYYFYRDAHDKKRYINY